MKKDDGLPEVAQNLQKKKPVIFIMLGVVLVACFIFSFSKSNKKLNQPVEETFSVTQNVQLDVIKNKPKLETTVITKTPDNPVVTQEQVALIRAKQDELQQRLSAPLMLVNNTQTNKPDIPTGDRQPSSDSNTQFLNQISGQATETSIATRIGPLNFIIAEGGLIHAILESATNSDLPGSVRAIVSEPCYSEDGTQVLIPRGTRLIGQYKSGMLQGQSRIFMVWTRLIVPGGISIQLGSPGVDSLGRAGMGADQINRHFWERFGTATLLSMISAGAANGGASDSDQDNSPGSFRAAIATSFAQSADQSLQQDSKIPPTLITHQGKPIMVFVSKDLNFQDAMKKANPKINIF